MKSWTYLTCVLFAGCAVAPVESAPEPKPVQSVAPLTQPADEVRPARPSRFVLPNDEVGLAVRGLIRASEKLAGEPARVLKEESMVTVRQRPSEVVRALEHAYDMLPASDTSNGWIVALTLSDLEMDEALPVLVKIANQPIPEATVESRADGTQPSTLAQTRSATITVATAVEGIAKLARTSSLVATKDSANAQLFAYFTHPQRMVKEAAVVGYLRAQGNTPAAKATATLKLATADRYIVNLKWGKNPGVGVSGMPTNPKAKLGEVRVTTTVPRKK